jgi:hypothetical protein
MNPFIKGCSETYHETMISDMVFSDTIVNLKDNLIQTQNVSDYVLKFYNNRSLKTIYDSITVKE